MKTIAILIIALSTFSSSWGQDIELFKGENKLNSCKVDIPLTYKKKDMPAYLKGATENKDVKLVLLKYDKKSHEVTYTYYYIVVADLSGKTFVYLEEPESHNLNSEETHMVFVEFKTKYDRFYTADCFDEILLNNPELSERLKKGE